MRFFAQVLSYDIYKGSGNICKSKWGISEDV